MSKEPEKTSFQGHAMVNRWKGAWKGAQHTTHQGNANQTTMRYHITPLRMTVIKQIRDQCWWNCGKRETLSTISENTSRCSWYGKH